jgi:hypothetical protein
MRQGEKSRSLERGTRGRERGGREGGRAEERRRAGGKEPLTRERYEREGEGLGEEKRRRAR